MPYIGRDLNRGNYLKLDDISSSFNSSTTTFNLTVGGSAFTPGSAFSILVSVGGVIQEPESAYQVNNSEITFANPPTAQDSFFCIALGVALGIGVPGNGTVNGTQMAKPFNYDGFFFLDDTNNRVGINSSTPTVALDVDGIIKASSFTGGSGGINAGVVTCTGLDLNGNGDVSGNFVIGGDLTVNGTTTTLDTNLIDVDKIEVAANNTTVGVAITQSGTGDILNLYDGSSEVFSVTDGGITRVKKGVQLIPETSNLYATDGALSYYATNNAVYLNGAGNNGQLRLNATGSNNDRTSINLCGQSLSNAQDSIVFKTATNERFRINAVGNIKVREDVQLQFGGVAYDNSDSDFQIYHSSLENHVGLTTHPLIISATGGERVRILANGNIGIGTDTAPHRLSVKGTISVISNASGVQIVNLSQSSNNGYVMVNDSTGTTRARLDASGSSYVRGGNFGVGTVSPTRSFHVKGMASGNSTNRMAIFETTGTSGCFIAFEDANTTDDSKCRIGSIGGNDIGIRGDSHSFQDGGGNNKMVITSAGRVGINETSPDVDLHIKNTNPAIYLEGTNGSGRQHKIWSAGTNSESLQFTSGNLLYNADVHYFRATNESTEYARITSEGALQIGNLQTSQNSTTHTSATKLHIDSTKSIKIARLAAGNITSAGWFTVAKVAASNGNYFKCYASIGGDFTQDMCVMELTGSFSASGALSNTYAEPVFKAYRTGAHSTDRITRARLVKDGSNILYLQIYIAGGVNSNTFGKSVLEYQIGAYSQNTADSGSDAMFAAQASGLTGLRTLEVDDNAICVNAGSHKFYSGGNAAERFTITSTGEGRFAEDVSIASGKKLFTNNSQGQLTIQGGATYPGSAIKFSGGQSGTTDQGQMIFYAGTATSLEEKVRITSGGNFGIGTDNPVARLHIHNSGTTSADHAYAFFTTGDTGSTASDGLTVGVAANQVASVNYREAGTLSLNTSATPRLSITSDGEVSIGQVDSSSSSALHIRSITSAETTLELSTKDNYNGSLPSAKISFTQQNGTEIARIKCDTSTGAANMADLTFWTNFGGLYERMRIIKTGTVQIHSGSNSNGSLRIGGNYDSTGTTNATAKLGTLMMPHYTNAEEPIQMIRGYSDSAQTLVSIGGGTSSANVATNIRFYTSSSGIDGGGTERLRIDKNGKIIVAEGELHSTRVLAKFGIDCHGLNIYDNVASVANYGLAFYNDPNTNYANGIGFFNDDGQTCGGYIVHQDKGGSNIGDIVMACAQTAGQPEQRLRLHYQGGIQINSTGNVTPFVPNMSGSGLGGGLVLTTPAYSEYQFTWAGASSATITLTCGSYFHSEFIYTQHQTNGGVQMHTYARGKWANNHTTHTGFMYEFSGGGSGLNTSFTVSDQNNNGTVDLKSGLTTAGAPGATYRASYHGGNENTSSGTGSATGKFVIDEVYQGSGLSVGSRSLIIRVWYGSFAISKS